LPSWKRVLDLICIVLASPILIPLAALIAIGIKIVSRGPVLFKQERVGLFGRHFECLKFRTMRVGADVSMHEGHLSDLMTANRPMTKLDSEGDSMVIPGGLILRALGLDELPQIINILRREMSLVGPRPCVPYEYERYSAQHKRRFSTVPGLTGLWQVSGKNSTTFEEMIDLDVHYAENKSLWLDLKIIFKTIPAILAQVLDLKPRPNLGKSAGHAQRPV